ncbi:MAG: B12-binding domain-containing radical SAM protein [Actinobacteria bacterium]|nr:B12-binding domain-containing radical SAM protein [Actinomycetota bacterium]
MKVCLVNPPFLFPRREDAVLSHCLGLRGLSSHLRSLGHEVTLVDALLLGFQERRAEAGGWLVGLAPEAIVERVPEDVQLIGVTAPFSQSAPLVHELCAALKGRFPDALLVMGGVYPSAQPESALRAEVDAIVVGEGETVLAALADGVGAAGLAGTYCPNGSREGVFERSRLVADLDTLAPPDTEVPHFTKYLGCSPRGATGRTASVVTSRGCPFDCEFCSIHPVYGRSFRARSAEVVLDEVERLVRGFGVRAIEIEDDNFTLDRGRAASILEGFVRLRETAGDVPFTWRPPNGIRIDGIDRDLLHLMMRSGCTEVVFGLEHGDPLMHDLMGKHLDLGAAFEMVKLCVQLGIPRITLFYMIGYPGETKEMFESGLRYLERIRALGGPVTVSMNLAQPYPGTRLLERCRAEGCDIDASYDDPLHRPGVMSTRTVIGVTSRGLDEAEILRRRELVMRLFGPRWKSVVKRGIPPRALRHLGAARPVSGRWKGS